MLANLPGLDLPSLQLTGALVLLYVLLVGPVNYLVLGAMRRRALAWVTVPLIAMIAAGGAYGAGVFAKGRSVQANQVTILHLQTGWDHAYQESYTGIMAPARGDYQASIAGARRLISPIATNGNFGPESRSGSMAKPPAAATQATCDTAPCTGAQGRVAAPAARPAVVYFVERELCVDPGHRRRKTGYSLSSAHLTGSVT